jgi:hypothetical protein
MTDWGPADWYVIAAGAGVPIGILLRILWAMSDPFAWQNWKDSFKRPKSDPCNRVPYRRPEDTTRSDVTSI